MTYYAILCSRGSLMFSVLPRCWYALTLFGSLTDGKSTRHRGVEIQKQGFWLARQSRTACEHGVCADDDDDNDGD